MLSVQVVAVGVKQAFNLALQAGGWAACQMLDMHRQDLMNIRVPWIDSGQGQADLAHTSIVIYFKSPVQHPTGPVDRQIRQK